MLAQASGPWPLPKISLVMSILGPCQQLGLTQLITIFSAKEDTKISENFKTKFHVACLIILEVVSIIN